MDFTTYLYNLVWFSLSLIFSYKNNDLSTKSEQFKVCFTCQLYAFSDVMADPLDSTVHEQN